ncbi:MAG: Hsp20/alpha crystallin family protein [Candidatus Niyogibacteria bacterium]|nr:MAG: Hsp20/alpha crystallin family protein [Candidatus Niyogibacteria bacterium]
MPKDRRSFLERLTGSLPASEEEKTFHFKGEGGEKAPLPQANDEGQLLVDVYQTPEDVVIQSVVSGVKPDELDVAITQEMVTIRGKREKSHHVSDDNYFYQELYWGSFSRSILLPQEVDVEASEATLKNGLLTVRLPKLDKAKIQKLKIKQE